MKTNVLPDQQIARSMKPTIGLDEEARQEVGEFFNLLLADEYVRYATTHDYHWNVAGPYFHSLHLLFEAQYGQIHQWLDDVAERTRAIGIGARGNWADLTKAARSSADPGIGLSPDHMLSELLALHEGLVVQLRTGAACAERFRDIGTVDFLTGLLKQHEKAAWMLRAHLETAEKETA